MHWSSFLLGFLAAFIASALLVALIVWWETRRKRLAAYEQFEHVNPEPCETTVYASPSYGVRIVK